MLCAFARDCSSPWSNTPMLTGTVGSTDGVQSLRCCDFGARWGAGDRLLEQAITPSMLVGDAELDRIERRSLNLLLKSDSAVMTHDLPGERDGAEPGKLSSLLTFRNPGYKSCLP